jgi:PhoPQ-activated pathogenicity-related protein
LLLLVVDAGRVMAICPIVLDAINFVDVEHHQWRSYGGWYGYRIEQNRAEYLLPSYIT